MIHKVLPVVTSELNDYFVRKFSLPAKPPSVLLSELVNLDGSVAVEGKNIVIATLINVEQERTNLNMPLSKTGRMNPPINIILHVLFSAYFPSTGGSSTTSYTHAMAFLSAVIGFFQGKQVFTPQNTPGLELGTVEKVTMEIVNLDLRELSNFWTAVGSKHLPSVLYKMRMLSISEEMILDEIPQIGGADANVMPS